MALTDVTLILDLYDGSKRPIAYGSASFTPDAALTDPTDQVIVTQQPVTASFGQGGFPSVQLLPTDNAHLQPSGWAWGAAFNVQGGLTSYFFMLPAGPASFTATNASPAVFTWTPTAALTALPNGTGVQLSGGSLPAGFVAATTYYVVASSGSTFELAATPGGSALASTGSGSGNVSVVQYNLSALTPVSPVVVVAPGGGEITIPVATTNITSGPVTPTATQEILRFDCTSGAISLVLPITGLNVRNVWRAVKMDAGSNPVNVTITGGGHFQDGTTTFVVSNPYSCYSFAVDGAGNAVVF